MAVFNRNEKRSLEGRSFRPTLEALEDRWLPAPVAPLSPLPAGIAAVFTGDFNGDGKTDLAQFTTDGRWLVSLNTSVVGGPTTYAHPLLWATWSPASMWRQLFVGDFNGDGKTDVAGLSMAGDWFVGVSEGTNLGLHGPSLDPHPPGTIEPLWVTFGGGFSTGAPWAHFGTGSREVWTKLFVADFNGDGKDDIAGFGFNGEWFVGLSQATSTSTNQSTFSFGAPWAYFGTGNPNVWIQTFVGDFNGDGKADIAGFDFNGNWIVGVSNGMHTFGFGTLWANWGSPSNWMDPGATTLSTSLMGDSNVATSSGTGPRIRLYMGDFNGDGKTDIAGLGFNGKLFVGLSAGAASVPLRGFGASSWANLGNPDDITALFVGNANGDAGTAERDDIIAFTSSGQWNVGLSQSGVGTNASPVSSNTLPLPPIPSSNDSGPILVGPPISVPTSPPTGWITIIIAPFPHNFFQVNADPNPYADYQDPANWIALAFGHSPTNYNPTEELAHPAEFSTEFNSPGTTMDTQADIAALGFNLSWYAGIATPSLTPSQFRTGHVAVHW
jgi:hypothetical protein